MKTLLRQLGPLFRKKQQSLRHQAAELLNNRRKLFLTFFGLASAALTGYCLASKIVICSGQSIDRHVFFKSSDRDYKTGQYVVIQTDSADPFAKGRLITKKIGCAPGETLKIAGDDYFCREEYLGKAKHYSKTGVPVKPFNPCGSVVCEQEVPDGMYFVVGTHKDSYDSRYFGFVPKEKIVARVIPLW